MFACPSLINVLQLDERIQQKKESLVRRHKRLDVLKKMRYVSVCFLVYDWTIFMNNHKKVKGFFINWNWNYGIDYILRWETMWSDLPNKEIQRMDKEINVECLESLHHLLDNLRYSNTIIVIIIIISLYLSTARDRPPPSISNPFFPVSLGSNFGVNVT